MRDISGKFLDEQRLEKQKFSSIHPSISKNETNFNTCQSELSKEVLLKHFKNMEETKKLIPKHCFEKNLWTSMSYYLIDLLVVGSQFIVCQYVPYYLLPIHWFIYGFFMWRFFVIGHDCGHGSFSYYPLLNDILGNLAHGMILVPYYPWQWSHSLHHNYHSHIEKDKSHPWREYTGQQFPFLYYLILSITSFFNYLYFGYYDGSHINPFSELFINQKQRIQCLISTIIVLGFLYLGYQTSLIHYLGSIFVFHHWLIMVTYMQHHDHETIVYDDTTWSYWKGALETVDRRYNYGIDEATYHITDGHIVHHLFFTQIPHYHLLEATNAIKPFLTKNYQYKYVNHSNIYMDFMKLYCKNFYFHWKLITTKENMKSAVARIVKESETPKDKLT